MFQELRILTGKPRVVWNDPRESPGRWSRRTLSQSDRKDLYKVCGERFKTKRFRFDTRRMDAMRESLKLRGFAPVKPLRANQRNILTLSATRNGALDEA